MLTMKKGKTIYQFLQKALEDLRSDFLELRSARFQITKTRQKLLNFFVKLTGHTYACNILTDFEYAVRVITGNGNYVDLLQSICKKLVK